MEEIEIGSEAKQASKQEGGKRNREINIGDKKISFSKKRERVGRRRRRSFFKGAASAGMK